MVAFRNFAKAIKNITAVDESIKERAKIVHK